MDLNFKYFKQLNKTNTDTIGDQSGRDALHLNFPQPAA